MDLAKELRETVKDSNSAAGIDDIGQYTEKLQRNRELQPADIHGKSTSQNYTDVGGLAVYDYYPGDYYPGDYYPGDYYPGDYYPGDYYPGDYYPGDYFPGYLITDFAVPPNSGSKPILGGSESAVVDDIKRRRLWQCSQPHYSIQSVMSSSISRTFQKVG